MHRLALLASLVSLFASAEEPTLEAIALSEDEFKMYQHYRNALEDPRVQALKAEQRVGAIARDAGFKLKELQRAVEKGEAAGDVKAKCEANLKAALGSSFGGRLGQVEVDTSAAQAVAYVQWFNDELKKLPVEACSAASAAVAACPLVSTVQVWAQDQASPKTRVFQALISSSGARRINVAKVADFAETRYLKLFEKMKSAANGDDFTEANQAADASATSAAPQ